MAPVFSLGVYLLRCDNGKLLFERPQDIFHVPLKAHHCTRFSAVFLSLNSLAWTPLCLYFYSHRAPLQGTSEVVSRSVTLHLAARRDPSGAAHPPGLRTELL